MKIIINMEPLPKARARTVRIGGKTMSFTPKKTADAESYIRAQIAESKVFFQSGIPLRIKMAFIISRPPSIAKKRLFPVTRPDIDNYCKLVLDACNRFLWADDSQIVILEAAKAYGQPPRIEIEIEAIE
jgi:Holliday junction resolvase RusA-like endonuclease